MRILLTSDLEPVTLKSYISVLKVFSYCGHQSAIWNKQEKSTFDIFDEIKPNIYIGKNPSQKELDLMAQYETVFIPVTSILAADIFYYRPLATPQPEINAKFFSCDIMSIINHDRSEIIKLNNILSQNYNMKLFSPFQYMFTEYCQNIPEENYAIALYWAKKVYATNFLNLFNFTLVNEKTIYPFYSEKENFSRNEILDNKTCFSVAKKIINEYNLQDFMETDFDSAYSKFRNENNI